MTKSAPSGPATLEPHYSSADSLVPVQTRSERFSSGNVDDFAAVVGREPEWRLSPVTKLRPLMDEPLDGSRYDLEVSPSAEMTYSWVTPDKSPRGVAGLPEDRLAANAWSSTQEVLVIEINGTPAEPLRIDRLAMGAAGKAAHTVIRVHPGSDATLIVTSSGDALLGENVEFDIHDTAKLHVVFVADWNAGSIQYASHFARVGTRAVFTHINVSLGGDVVIVNPSTQLVGEGSEGHLWGAYFADATQHLESRVYVHHQGPQSVSRVTYKGALHGAGARTVWIGDVLIGAHAVGTDSYEQNRNLVLSEGTRADSIPNLEIKTGDIAGAGHASATGRFDDEQLFYLQSRGIEELDARRLVVMGFLIDVISRINDPELVASLTERVRNKLSLTVEAS